MTRAWGRLGLVLLAVVSLTACFDPRALGDLPTISARDMLRAPSVVGGARSSASMAGTLAGLGAILLGFVCWYRATHGSSWVRLLGTYLGGLLGCVFVLGTWFAPIGVPEAGLGFARWTGEQLKPSQNPWVQYQQRARNLASASLKLFTVVGKGQSDQAEEASFKTAEAAVYWLSEATSGQLVQQWWPLSYGITVLLQLAQAWLLAFYFALGPLCAPMLILPSTRGVFWGWLRQYLSVCLWTPVLCVMDRVMLAIPAALGNAWLAATWSEDLGRFAEGLVTAFVSSGIIAVLIALAYLSVPLAAYGLVNGLGRPFRGAL